MALLFMDSFDHYVTADLLAKWSTTVNGTGLVVSVTAANGRRGSGSLRLTATSIGPTILGNVVKTLAPADPTTGLCGFAVAISTAALIGTSGTPLSSFRDAGTAQVTLRLNADLTLSVTKGITANPPLGTTSAGLSVGTPAFIEWKVVIHPSAGTVEVRINGVTRLQLTGQNTRNTANSSWNGVSLGSVDGTAQWVNLSSGTLDYDDLYVVDGSGAAPWNTFLGDVRVDPRLPTGAGATTGWTPSTGANYAAVDEAAPNGDTDYVGTTTVPATDTYALQDAPVAGATIYGVQHCLNMKKMDAGACTVAPVIRHSGVDYVGADLAPGTSYAYGLQIAAVNPGTSAAWTEAGFNAAEFGAKRTS